MRYNHRLKGFKYQRNDLIAYVKGGQMMEFEVAPELMYDWATLIFSASNFIDQFDDDETYVATSEVS